MDVRLLLARRPPSCILDVPSSQTPLGVILVASGTAPFLYVTARPATEAAFTALYLRGRRCTAAPNGPEPPTTHVPQPLLHWVRRIRASQALTDGGVALPTEQARGGVRQVCPLPPRRPGTGGLRRDRLPRSLYTRNGKRPHTIQEACDNTSAGLHEDPLTASRGRPSEEGLISPRRRRFSTALSSGAHAFHRSSHQVTPCAVSKTSNRHLKAVFPRYCAHKKTGPAAQRTGDRRVATRKTTGDLATRRAAGDPE